jgi:hypothetical protein
LRTQTISNTNDAIIGRINDGHSLGVVLAATV